MQNLQQIKTIHKALELERHRILSELAKLNDRINKKSANITKISAYQKEYANGENLQTSLITPLLHKNLYSFSKKILVIIAKEESELNILKSQRDGINQRVMKMDLKIKIIEHFEARVLKKALTLQERSEQSMLDDLASIKSMREES
jgi:flagellar biosynthesis chaperone FliJ